MDILQALLLSLIVLLIGLALFQIAIQGAGLILKKKISLSLLFKDFKKKIWMTIGIGVLFFGLYVFLLFLGSFLINPDMRLNFFFTAYQNPTAFIYLGLLSCACISTSIYGVRLAIKYFYSLFNK